MGAKSAAAALIIAGLLLPSSSAAGQQKKKEANTDTGVSFSKQILPILKDRCDGCHYPKDAKGKLDVTTYASFRKGGKTPNMIVPGDPDKSFLVKQIVGDKPVMPKNANPLKAEQIDLITRWIKEGAKNN